MYKIHIKAKFIVIDTNKPITRNVNISNIQPHPLSLDKKSRFKGNYTSAQLTFYLFILQYFLKKVYTKIILFCVLFSITF